MKNEWLDDYEKQVRHAYWIINRIRCTREDVYHSILSRNLWWDESQIRVSVREQLYEDQEWCTN